MKDFMPKVRGFFTAPKKNEHLAGFFHFLLQVFNSELSHSPPLDGDEMNVVLGMSLFIVEPGVRFFLAVLGDVPFLYTEMDEVKNLLTGFEAVANRAASVVYSCIFRTSRLSSNQIFSQTEYFLDEQRLLVENIKEHCIKFSNLPLPSNKKSIDAVGSLLIVESLLEDLENFMTCHDSLTDDIKNPITALSKLLFSAQAFLKDINVSRETEFPEVIKECVLRLRDVVYEANYLISSFIVRNIPLWYLTLRIPNVIEKLELIGKRCEEVSVLHGNKVSKLDEEDLTHVVVSSQAMVPTSAASVDHAIVGFESEMISFLDKLTGGSENLQIISICGMPGLGKTTLAKKLFNDRLITDRFDERSWCIVSQSYSKRKVLIQIFMSLRSTRSKDKSLKMDDESLSLEIYQTLKGRRYFIVMDDAWDSDVWYDLKRYFPDDRKGSRILITSRNRNAVLPMSSNIQTLPLLSEDECWELLEKKVFPDEPCPPQLESSGKRIAAKCNGLPLAVVIIAGTLANMEKEKCAWENVEENINIYASNCMNILELSYRHLPNHLKLCFLYFGVFAEDAEIHVKKLIQLWIIEGFIRKEKDKSQEYVAEEYLMDLINRSLVLVSRTRSSGGVKTCNVHDLLREMCLGRAKEEHFLSLIKDDNISTQDQKHHRLRALSTAPGYLRPLSLHCRSFFGYLSDPSSCLPQMKDLRVMELSPCIGMSERYIFKRFDLLFHLKYLVIDRMIPEPVLHRLPNLEVLCVDTMLHAVNITTIILKLVKLRHLHVSPHAMMVDRSNGSQPYILQSLSDIIMPTTKNYNILRSLTNLRKLTCTCQQLLLPDFCLLTKLEALKILIDCCHSCEEIPINDRMLSVPPTIRKLYLSGTQLPWERMSVLGRLPELVVLKLFWDAFEGEEWKTNDDEFQKLSYLEIGKVKLKQWITMSEHFPRLHHLVLAGCNKLQTIPTDLGDIPTLQKIEVHECSYGASISAIQVEQEQRENENYDLQVIITNRRWSKEQLVSEYKEINNEPFSSSAGNESFDMIHSSEVDPVPSPDRSPSSNHTIRCESCDISPIVGDKYKCKDCVEGLHYYYLCKDCYLNPSKHPIPGRFNHKHTSKHTFEIVTSTKRKPYWDGNTVKHPEVSCDSCGMSPIAGERYKCKDCMDDGGYDLCGDCYQDPSKHPIPGPHNQKHTSEHQFELVTLNDLVPNKKSIDMDDGNQEEAIIRALRVALLFYLLRSNFPANGLEVAGPSTQLAIDQVAATSAAQTMHDSPPLNLLPQESISSSVTAVRSLELLQSINGPVENPQCSDPCDQDVSDSVSDRNLDQMVEQLIEMGGGSWDKETVMLALRAAYYNPERAVDYLYSGIPDGSDIAGPSTKPATDQVEETVQDHSTADVSGAPNSSMSSSQTQNLLPQESVRGTAAGIDMLDILRKNPEFQALRRKFLAHPQFIEPVLQELGKRHHSLSRFFQENYQGMLQLINEPVDSSDDTDILKILRDTPPFLALRPMFQANPETIEALANQHPSLPGLIQANYQQIIELMNEPIDHNSESDPCVQGAYPCVQVASSPVTDSNLEQTIDKLTEMGDGNWDKETAKRALKAAYNNPVRAVEYLHSGIPDGTEVVGPSTQPSTSAAHSTPAAPDSPLQNLLPQETCQNLQEPVDNSGRVTDQQDSSPAIL